MGITVVKGEVVGTGLFPDPLLNRQIDHLEQNYRGRCVGKGTSKKPEMELSEYKLSLQPSVLTSDTTKLQLDTSRDMTLIRTFLI